MFRMRAKHPAASNSDQASRLVRRYRIAAAAIVAGLLAGSAAVAYARHKNDTTAPIPVVVELFTSEGCSSCPPIDTFLRKVDTFQPIKGVQVIGIEEHVDYWNQDGWVDPYSALEWTERQEAYVMKFKDKTPFTPQLVVAGDKEMVGANTTQIFSAIRQAAEQENVQVSVQPGTADGKDAQQFSVRVTSAGSAKPAKADVWLAVTENGLEMQVTSGENSGRTLQHASVIRSLEKIGTLSDKTAAAFTADPRVKFKSSWKKPNLHIVVFVQDHKSLQIVGAGSANVTG
jgi:hypothetical protein